MMSEGVTVELNELIALQRGVRRVAYHSPAKSLRNGQHTSKIRGRGMDFAEVRHYQAGDEVRHMEWRVTARTGQPHVKLYHEERERPVVLLVDFNPSMYFGTRKAFKSVVAAKLAATIAWTVVSQNDKIGALLFAASKHSELTPQSRNRGILPLLASLSQYSHFLEAIDQAQVPNLFNDALCRLRRVLRPGSILVIVSDFYQLDEDGEKHMSRLRAHNDILAYQICDPIELQPPKPGQYAVTNGQDQLLLDTFDKGLLTEYQQWCQARQEQVQAMFKRLQSQTVLVTSDMDLTRLVQQTYPRRARG